jgi:PII-like signaling protein
MSYVQKERRLGASGNKVLRKVTGIYRDRRSQEELSEEIKTLYAQNVINMIK